MYKLTGSKPEIDSYPFTTKRINVAYIKEDKKKIQLLDVPGTLNRFNKMNDIEKQAELVINYLADLIVYVFDLTENYPLENQVKLFDNIKKLNKKIIVYLSKTDLIEEKIVNNFKNKLKNHEIVNNIKELKNKLLINVST